MKVVLLAGGKGTRIQEETSVKPKPMIEIGGKPILWHIMKHYAHYGFLEFFIALGYKGEVIKRYFLDYYTLNRSLTINLASGEIDEHQNSKKKEDWIVHLVDTGLETLTGERVRRLEPWLQDGTFMVTYGDGVSSINLQELLHFHKKQGKLATVTAVRPPARFGGLIFDGDLVAQFTEKPQAGEGWINGGFLVFEPGIFSYLEENSTTLEVDLLTRLAAEGQLSAYRHESFWQCMDTLRDLRLLQQLWDEGNPPWKIWE